MVNEFNVIVVMNEAMLKLLKDKNAQFDSNLKIKKMLEDEAIFFKIDKSDAYQMIYLKEKINRVFWRNLK